MVTRGEMGERDKLGIWEQEIQTTIHKIGKQQDLFKSRGNYIQYFLITYNGK